jgi:hypothetical protein
MDAGTAVLAMGALLGAWAMGAGSTAMEWGAEMGVTASIVRM